MDRLCRKENRNERLDCKTSSRGVYLCCCMVSVIQMLGTNSPPVVTNEVYCNRLNYPLRNCVAVLIPGIHFICTFKTKAGKVTVLSKCNFIKVQQQNQLHLRLKVFFWYHVIMLEKS